MRKGENLQLNDKSARENILVLGALSGGEIRESIAKELCSTPGYFYNVIARMKNKKEGEIYTDGAVRTVRLKAAGLDFAEKFIPYLDELSKMGTLGKKGNKSERRAAISQMLYNMLLAGIKIFPLEKPVLGAKDRIDATLNHFHFYTSGEVKALGSKELDGSRMHGVLVGRNRIICTYNTLDRASIRYCKKIEKNAQIQLEKRSGYEIKSEIVFYTDDQESFFKKMLINTAKQEKMPINKSLDTITADIKGYVIPNGKEGALYSKLLLYPQIVERLKERALESEKREVISLLPLSLAGCHRLAYETKAVSVLCLNEQRELINSINPGENIFIVEIERNVLESIVEKYIREFQENM